MSGFFLYFLIISGFVSKKYISSFDFEAGDDAFMQEDNLREHNLHIRVKLKKMIKMWEKRFSEAKFQRNITCLWPGREVLCRCYPNVISKWQW